MKEIVEKILAHLDSAPSGEILDSSKANILAWVKGDFLPEWALNSILELFENRAYGELNDRFFKNLEFATAGMRGRTIGKQSASFEMGKVSEQGTPEHAAVGSNNMNDFNVAKATIGLFNYCKDWCDKNNLGTPRLVIAHDVRHFSRHFCELAASIWAQRGGEVMIFDGPRSIPQLSYTVIKSKATAGVGITASHNPACDNGYKVYFSDGAQASSTHSKGITQQVNSASFDEVKKSLQIDLSGVRSVDKSLEDSYIKSIADCVIDKEIMKLNKPKIVFSAVHGTGGVLCPKIMREFGLEPILVEEQMVMDPRFPTVKQPNPEYPETLSKAIALMEKTGAECVVATDPDADRMGVAFRAKDGASRLLTGNMIGALLIDYRIKTMLEKGVITSPKNCAVVKSFVTSPLQDEIAHSYGLKLINTLTGFKWIGAKLNDYQEALMRKLPDLDYWAIPYAEKAKLLQEHSTFFVFGDEESYGFLGTDFVRDKDANMAVIMFSEMVASLKSKGMGIEDYLEQIYLKNGYFLEDLKSIYKEGASGAQIIKDFLANIEEKPLEFVNGVKVASVMNFNKDDIRDEDGKKIPPEKFFFYKLENGYSFAIRASGTEPKIKFYAFAKESAKDKSDLESAKSRARKNLDGLFEFLTKLFGEK